MDWIDKINRDLEERRNRNKTSEGIEESNDRKKQWIASRGGNTSMPKGVYGNVQKKGNESAYEMGAGIHNKDNPNYKKWKSNAGKLGGNTNKQLGLGIHDPIKSLEYKRLGGLAQVKNLNIDKICPHCNITTRGAGYNRWHGDNCKHKK